MSDNNKIQEFLQKLAPCIERGDLDACVEEAARVAREMGIGAEKILDLSKDIGKSGKYDFAYILALAAAQGFRGNEKADAYSNAGLAAQYLGKTGKAEEHYKKAIEVNPKHAEGHYNYANLLKELNRKDEAEEHYKKAIDANPKLAQAYYNYAILLKELNRKDEAEEHYKKAIDANPKYAEAHSNYAILLELNRKDEAEEHYKKAIEANPKLSEAHSNYAVLLSELNRKSEAEEHYKKAIETNPKLADAHSNYAVLLSELNRKSEAEDHYKKAIESDPKHALAHNNYAFLLEELYRKSEAEEHYKKAIEINPEFLLALNNYANLLRKKGQLIGAEEKVRKVLQNEPKNPYALGILGDILADEGLDFKEAKKAYQEALKNPASMKAPAVAEIHNNLGWVSAQLKQYSEAKEDFTKAIRLDPLNAKAHHNYRALGKVEEWIKSEISKIQKYLAFALFITVIATWYLFMKEMLSENVFAAQSTTLIALLIFILLYHQISKFKAGPIEFEMSTEHMSQTEEALSKNER